jgi:hypothetical protein
MSAQPQTQPKSTFAFRPAATAPEIGPSDAGAERYPGAERYRPAPRDAAVNLRSAGPCSNVRDDGLPCISPMFWLDPYGRLHCCQCRPAPAAAMVRQKLVAVRVSSSRVEWSDLADELEEKQLAAAIANGTAPPPRYVKRLPLMCEWPVGMPFDEWWAALPGPGHPLFEEVFGSSKATAEPGEPAGSDRLAEVSDAQPAARLAEVSDNQGTAPPPAEVMPTPETRDIAPAVAPITVKGEGKSNSKSKRQPKAAKSKAATKSFLDDSEVQ